MVMPAADERQFALPFFCDFFLFISSGEGDCWAVPCSWLYSIMSFFSPSSVHVFHYHPRSLLAAGPFFPFASFRSDVSVEYL